MAKERIITALDLGSHRVRAGTLLIGPAHDLKIIGVGERVARGIRRHQRHLSALRICLHHAAGG